MCAWIHHPCAYLCATAQASRYKRYLVVRRPASKRVIHGTLWFSLKVAKFTTCLSAGAGDSSLIMTVRQTECLDSSSVHFPSSYRAGGPRQVSTSVLQCCVAKRPKQEFCTAYCCLSLKPAGNIMTCYRAGAYLIMTARKTACLDSSSMHFNPSDRTGEPIQVIIFSKGLSFSSLLRLKPGQLLTRKCGRQDGGAMS
jgi:hypothetical protein